VKVPGECLHVLVDERGDELLRASLVRGKRTADPSATLGMTKRGGRMKGRERLLKVRVLVKGQVLTAGWFFLGENVISCEGESFV
jgi:hypothetical protein